MLTLRSFPHAIRTAIAVVAVALCAVNVRAQELVAPEPSASPSATASSNLASSPIPTPAPAASPQLVYPSAAGAKIGGPRQGNEAAGVTNLGVTFLVLVGLCAGGYYFVRRQPGFVASLKSGPRKLTVSESRSLGNRQFLVVVEYEHERMLLGVTPGKIDYLCPLRSSEADAPVFPVPGGANP